MFRNSRSQVLYAKPFPKHFKNFKENIFIGVVFCKDVGLELATLSEKKVQRRFFAVKFVEFLKTASCRTTEND